MKYEMKYETEYEIVDNTKYERKREIKVKPITG